MFSRFLASHFFLCITPQIFFTLPIKTHRRDSCPPSGLENNTGAAYGNIFGTAIEREKKKEENKEEEEEKGQKKREEKRLLPLTDK